MLVKENLMLGLNEKRYAHVTALLFFIASLAYCFFILKIAQFHYIFEILIAVVFPIVASPFFKKADNWVDVKRLIILETGFNILCIVTKATNDFEVDWGLMLSWVFAVFFTIQAGGFIVSQYKKGIYKCVPSSIAMGIGLTYWFATSLGEETFVTSEGEVMIYGANTPLYMQLVYVFWVTNTLLVEFRQYLPKATMYLSHIASMVVALTSNEFFHARIFVASHLFVLSTIFVYKAMDWNGVSFSVIPSTNFLKNDKHIVTKNFPHIMTAGCYASLFYWMFLT